MDGREAMSEWTAARAAKIKVYLSETVPGDYGSDDVFYKLARQDLPDALAEIDRLTDALREAEGRVDAWEEFATDFSDHLKGEAERWQREKAGHGPGDYCTDEHGYGIIKGRDYQAFDTLQEYTARFEEVKLQSDLFKQITEAARGRRGEGGGDGG